LISVRRYAARTGSALALLLTFIASAHTGARAAERATFTFEGQRITFTQIVSQAGGRAISIDDPGLHAFFDRIGATITYQPGDRYVLVTTAEPVVISFAMGDRRYDIGPITQNAAFAPFMQGGHAYVPLNELLHGLDFAAKTNGGNVVLQPQLAAIDVDSNASGTKIVAHAGMPLDARVVSDMPDKLVIAFDGVGSTLDRTRNIAAGAVRRMDIRTEGSVSHPVTYVTLFLNPGSSHSAPGTDDQRDFTIGFNGAASANAQPVAQAQTPASPTAAPIASATPAGPVQVTGVTSQNQNGSTSIHVAVDGSASFEWHRLRPPDNRFWIDVHGARLATPPSDQQGSAPVTAIRVHQQSPDTVRVALSLSDFNVLSVTPDATGVTILVSNALADETVARAGAGTVGAVAAVAAPQPSPSPAWKFTPQATPSPSTYVAPNPRLIVIDPGHGGSDTGAYRGDAVEKDLALDMSKRLKSILIARGWQVIMTRETDRDVFAPNDSAHDELQARDDVANNNGARLLISIHVNSFINSGPHGATAYYYKATDVALAQAVDRRIAAQVPVKNIGIIKDKLYVVNHATMPATLVETAFVSNPDDRRLLMDPAWRQKMAQAIADGILDYAGTPPAAANDGGQ
jgi:N-acetylmuramoyl-L-alanine amidase CwlD